jgi:para-aminobenzoate synthetase/4-amino-4-deoxychorismate lyase
MRPLPPRFHALADSRPGSVLLETTRPGPGEDRSYLFLDPERVLSLSSPDDAAQFFADMDSCLEDGLHLAGFLCYELGCVFEPRSLPLFRRDSRLPLAWFGAYRAPFVFDHGTGRSDPEPPAGGGGDRSFRVSGCALLTPRDAYCAQVERVRELIASGETYQVNLTNRVRFDFSGSPVGFFRALSERQSVPYAAFIRLGEARILSASPELFFRIEGRTIETRPMKGTAPRGRDAAEDERLGLWLQADPKNRSENVMIVDLLRNDLARVSRIGTVETRDVLAVEAYETLFQMTSTVRSSLLQGAGPRQVLGALFPSGSITGAPKLRTLAAIRELEEAPRGIYTGAIGFFSPSGGAAFNVAIRTILLDGGRGEMGVGSGVVYDSSPEREFEECLLKARFLTDFEWDLLETILWKDGYHLLPYHLERLQDSAVHLGFPYPAREIDGALSSEAARHAPGESLRVRLLLGRDGTVRVESSPCSPQEALPTVMLADLHTSSADPFLRHKTTRRELYNAFHRKAASLGHADAIFRNERGEITEGTIHNVFVLLDGQLLTPPVSSGLLPGVERRHVLETDPRAREQVLRLEDLLQAEALYLSNSVRGLLRVRLVR